MLTSPLPTADQSGHRKKTAAAIKKNKLNFKEQKEYETLETEIQQLENKNKELTAQLNSGKVTNHQELMELAEKIKKNSEAVDEKSLRWMELEELKEALITVLALISIDYSPRVGLIILAVNTSLKG